MAKLINTSARLYAISHGDKWIDIPPAGEAVEVPEAALKSPCVQEWIEIGDLVVTESGKKAKE